ncbi:MAG: D-glycero-alpha-D-manno-heptose-1,7-bisphosphate 7-phosphatase [Endomicrobiia bacterium]
MATNDKFPMIFLDRDGTIIVDKVYLNDPQDIEFFDGVIDGLKKLVEKNFKLVIVTNQSGVARGLVNIENLNKIHQKILEILNSNGVDVYKIYFCPHLPEENCSCRKPKTGMVKEIEHLIDKEKSFMVGDKEIDVEFGKNLGIRTILISNDKNIQSKAEFVVKNFLEAVNIILNHIV